MQNRGRPAPMFLKTRHDSFGSASTVNRIDAASTILGGTENALEHFELHFAMRSVGR